HRPRRGRSCRPDQDRTPPRAGGRPLASALLPAAPARAPLTPLPDDRRPQPGAIVPRPGQRLTEKTVEPLDDPSLAPAQQLQPGGEGGTAHPPLRKSPFFGDMSPPIVSIERTSPAHAQAPSSLIASTLLHPGTAGPHEQAGQRVPAGPLG